MDIAKHSQKTAEAKAKNCPWCGTKAHIIELDIDFYKIGCTNVKCAIQPSLNFKWCDKDKSIDNWNTREDDGKFILEHDTL